MRPPPPAAATLKVRRMVDAVTGTWLTAAEPGPPLSAEVLTQTYEAGAFLLNLICGRQSLANQICL